MVSVILAGLLACTGQTKNLKTDLSVDYSAMTIAGTLTDANGVATEVIYEGLHREKACLISNQLSFCYSAQHGIASIDLVMADGHVERGSMKCQ